MRATIHEHQRPEAWIRKELEEKLQSDLALGSVVRCSSSPLDDILLVLGEAPSDGFAARRQAENDNKAPYNWDHPLCDASECHLRNTVRGPTYEEDPSPSGPSIDTFQVLLDGVSDQAIESSRHCRHGEEDGASRRDLVIVIEERDVQQTTLYEGIADSDKSSNNHERGIVLDFDGTSGNDAPRNHSNSELRACQPVTLAILLGSRVRTRLQVSANLLQEQRPRKLKGQVSHKENTGHVRVHPWAQAQIIIHASDFGISEVRSPLHKSVNAGPIFHNDYTYVPFGPRSRQMSGEEELSSRLSTSVVALSVSFPRRLLVSEGRRRVLPSF